MPVSNPPMSVLPPSLAGNTSAARIDVIPRDLVQNGRTLANGAMALSFFTPDTDFVVSNLICESRGAGTGATLTRMALFVAPSASVINCIARTANDVTILASANARFSRAIADNGAASPGAIASVTLTRGLRYAFAVLGVGWSGAPQAGGNNSSFSISEIGPLLGAVITGQTDIGSTYSAGIDPDATRLWGGLT